MTDEHTALRPAGDAPERPKLQLMVRGNSIAELRSRVAALVEEESRLLTRAFEMSKEGGDRRGVDSLFAQVQALQVQRNGLKQELGNALGTHRMHVASEVWREGLYDYREEVGASAVRVRVSKGPLGLQVRMPGAPDLLRIEQLEGTFDGPLSADDAEIHGGEASQDARTAKRPRTTAAARSSKKKP